MAWLKSVHEANDQLDNNVVVSDSSDDTVNCTVQMQGVHTKDWDLSFMGLGVIPATNKAWNNPVEEMTATMRDGKVLSLSVSIPDGGGIAGILAQLGVNADD